MKIGKPADIPQTEGLSRPTDGARAIPGHAADGAVEKTSPVDAVHLSKTSRSLAAESTDENVPVQAAKVEEIRAAIREGRFHVNAAAVAEKMITQAAELLETLTKK